jgi:hypothetical protein
LNFGLLNSHSLADAPWIGAGAATRHDELIGTSVDHFNGGNAEP